MPPDLQKWLCDIVNAIIEVESFVSVGFHSFSDLDADLKTRRAVERELEIIGEAMSRILK